MQISSKITTNLLEVSVTFSKEEAAEIWSKAQNALIGTVRMPGFRKGKVPLSAAKSFLSDSEIAERATRIAGDRAFDQVKEDEAVKADNIYEIPSIEATKMSENEMELKFIYEVIPTITTLDYKNLMKDEPAFVPKTEEDARKEVKDIQRNYAARSIKGSGVINEGDVVNFDFEGFNKEGTAFKGGSAKDFELEIGSNRFIPGFESQMIGMKKGEEKTLAVTFPSDYHDKTLAGQPVTFKVKVNEVKELTMPEINAEFVARLGVKDENVKSAEGLEKLWLERTNQYLQKEYDQAMHQKIFDLLEKQVDVKIPASLIGSEKEKIRKNLLEELKQQKSNLTKYLKQNNMDSNQLEKNLETVAIKNIKVSLALEYVITEEKIEVSKEDINQELEKLAQLYGVELDKIKQLISDTSMIEAQLLNEKALKLLKK